MNKIIKTKSEAETRAVAARFAKTLKGGEIVALIGDLGAGKTQWVKGMAKGLGVKNTVISPTFILLQCFKIKILGIKQLCHVDAYRLKSSQELLSIGIEDYLGALDTVTVIEWAERVEELLKEKNVIRVKIEFGEKGNERVIKIF